MSRLPTPGGDDDTWGNILNDFLGVSHNADGTLKDTAVTTGNLTDGSVTEAKLAGAVQTKLNASSSDATASTKGVIQLTGDLGGTAASPTVPGLASKANTSHTHTLANITDVTATAAKLNYTTNVTSDIQAQLNSKSATGHTHTVSNLTDYPTQRARMEKSTTGPAYSGGTWTKVTGFDAADFAIGITADATNGNFTIVTSGIYDITFYQRWQDYGTAYYRIGAIMLGTSAPPTGANAGANGAILALSQSNKTDWYVDTLHAESVDLVAGNTISFWIRSGTASTWNSAGDNLINKPPYVLIRRVSA